MSDKLFGNVSIQDKKILKALSDIGIYISNYVTGETLSSIIWDKMPDKFDINQPEKGFLQYIHPDDRDKIRKKLIEISEGKDSVLHEIYRIEKPDGESRWIHSYGKTVFSDTEGKPILFIGSDSDISDLKETEENLRQSIKKEQERFNEVETIRQISSIISSSLDVEETVDRILQETSRIIPYRTGTVQLLRGNTLKVSGAAGFPDNSDICSLTFPYPQEGSLSTKALEEQKPIRSSDIEKDFPSFIQPANGEKIQSWIGIPLISHGEILGLLALDGYDKNAFTRHHLELAGTIGNHISIALENAMLHEKAFKMAMKDALTGIGNRHRFQMEGRILLEAAIRSKRELAVIILDIDHFKIVNDRFGHPVGDRILRRVADICSREIRSIDLLARYGGEEFVLIMPDTEYSDALKAAERVRTRLETTVHPETGESITASFGIHCCIPAPGERISRLLTRADKGLYEAKRSGRNRCCCG